jgi:hypothetical protein
MVVSQFEVSSRPFDRFVLRWRMRKLVLFILSSTMLIGGIYAAIFELLFARIIFFRFVIGGAILAFVGAYLMWTDFIAPKPGIKTWEG